MNVKVEEYTFLNTDEYDENLVEAVIVYFYTDTAEVSIQGLDNLILHRSEIPDIVKMLTDVYGKAYEYSQDPEVQE